MEKKNLQWNGKFHILAFVLVEIVILNFLKIEIGITRKFQSRYLLQWTAEVFEKQWRRFRLSTFIFFRFSTQFHSRGCWAYEHPSTIIEIYWKALSHDPRLQWKLGISSNENLLNKSVNKFWWIWPKNVKDFSCVFGSFRFSRLSPSTNLSLNLTKLNFSLPASKPQKGINCEKLKVFCVTCQKSLIMGKTFIFKMFSSEPEQQTTANDYMQYDGGWFYFHIIISSWIAVVITTVR